MVQRTADDRDAALDRLRLELHTRTAEHALMITDRADATQEVTQGQILSQSPTDATLF